MNYLVNHPEALLLLYIQRTNTWVCVLLLYIQRTNAWVCVQPTEIFKPQIQTGSQRI